MAHEGLGRVRVFVRMVVVATWAMDVAGVVVIVVGRSVHGGVQASGPGW